MSDTLTRIPVNPNATKEARDLLACLCDTAGHGIIAGQHTQTRAMEELTLLRELTGREPKLLGFELLGYSPNINHDTLPDDGRWEVESNQDTIDLALQWAKASGGIVTLTFHWYAPLGGSGKSFYAETADFDPTRVLIEGTPERAAFYHDMDAIAAQLRRFQDEGIPVLWRPFHESEGTWFWWGSKGPATAGALFRLMYDYYTREKHLDHLLWVWNCDEADGYPGDDYVDVVSKDVYFEEPTPSDFREAYDKLVAATSARKVAAIAECGRLPSPDALARSHTPWAYYMTWSRWFCVLEETNKHSDQQHMYAHPYVISAPISDFTPGESAPAPETLSAS